MTHSYVGHDSFEYLLSEQEDAPLKRDLQTLKRDLSTPHSALLRAVVTQKTHMYTQKTHFRKRDPTKKPYISAKETNASDFKRERLQSMETHWHIVDNQKRPVHAQK